jgi:hypothetical protein
MKDRAEKTATKLSTVQAAQLKPLGVFLKPPFRPHSQLISLRIDMIDDPSVGQLDPITLAQAAILNIKKGDPASEVLDPPRMVSLGGDAWVTFSAEHASHYVKTLDTSGVSRARLWFFSLSGGRWLKVNLVAPKEDWAGLQKDSEFIEKSMRFNAPDPKAKTSREEILDGLGAFR